MNVQAATDRLIETSSARELPHEEDSGIWGVVSQGFSLIGKIFGWLNTSYNYGSQYALYMSKSGGHLINGGTLSGMFRLDLDYTTIKNSGVLSSAQGVMAIRAKHFTLSEGGKLVARDLELDTETIVIDGGTIEAESIKVISCTEIIIRNVREGSPTFAILEHLPSGCNKTVTISSSN